MKAIKYTVGIIWAITTLIACNDIVEVDDLRKKQDPPSTGAPIVEKIVLATDTLLEITGANMEDMVKIEGRNLGNVTKIRFNDIEVEPAEIYSTYYMTVVPVPRVKPEEINDILYLETEKGSLEIPFVVSVPPLRIDGLKNEFAQPGDTTIIVGDNFDLYGVTVEEADIRMGDMFVNVLGASRKEITIQIPTNAQPNSIITINAPNMEETAEVEYMNPGIRQLFNFNDWPGFGAYTHSANYPGAPKDFLNDGTIEDSPEPLMEGMKYLRFNYKVKGWGWAVLWAGNIFVPAEIANDPSAYELRFEINTNSKFPLGTVNRIMIGTYGWYPAVDGLPLNTYGAWQTVRISADAVDREGNTMWKGGAINPDLNNPYCIVFSPEQEQEYDVSMTNFRFARK